MKKSILIIALALFCSTAFCQEISKTLQVKGVTTSFNVTKTSSKLSEVAIHVFKYNKYITTFYSNKKGKFEFDIPKNSYITLAFEKENFVVKRIQFDTRVDNNKEVSSKPFDLEVALLENVDGIDFSVLDFPITRIEYIREYDEYSYVEKYTNNMLKLQEDILLQMEDMLLSNR